MSASRAPHVCECGDHAFAALTKGFVVLVSPEDIHHLRRPWHANVRRQGNARAQFKAPSGRMLLLSREIANPSDGMVVDHANRDTLDNRRPNLRVCSSVENAWNRVKPRHKRLPKGVTKHRSSYRSSITINGKKIHLGCFATESAAYAAYCEAAHRLQGEFARVE